MNLLIFLLIGFGITTIITLGRIFEPVRNYFDNGIDSMKYNFYGLLITCPMCVGFWTGIFLSFALYSPTDFYFYSNDYVSTAKYVSELILSPIFDGTLLAGVTWSIHSILALFDRLYEHTMKLEVIEEEKLKFEERRNQILQSEPLPVNKPNGNISDQEIQNAINKLTEMERKQILLD